jgi:hypothetical protein
MTLGTVIRGLPGTVVDVRMARSFADPRGGDGNRILFTRILVLFGRVPFEYRSSRQVPCDCG